jgi:hypothetical protein
MLRIFHTHPARTSLLKDFAFYEVRVRNFAFDLAFISRVASSDAKSAGASTAAAARRKSFHIRKQYSTIAFPSPAADHVLDGKHGEHACYVWSDAAGHGWRFISAYALHANGDEHDDPAVWYAADSGHAPKRPASP